MVFYVVVCWVMLGHVAGQQVVRSEKYDSDVPTLSPKEDKTSALTFELQDADDLCFYEQFVTGGKYVFEYQVLKGGKLDVDVLITSPRGKHVYEGKKQKSDKTVFDTGNGIFSFCFSNRFSAFTHKIVYFSLRSQNIASLAARAGRLRRPTVMTSVEASMEQINQDLQETLEYQTAYRLRELSGRSFAEDMSLSVLSWSVICAVLIFITGVGQVIILKTFFTHTHTSQKQTSSM
ncbi:transmembrane emp24 domain-containing protein 7-like [Saccoglossus kowalevskii]|uniref:Transmembrane emp24 domain-containing protein 7-like n=1 Tax=Saccoglossus kowalevskii TaxID=10224 RepID=A0ABM0GLM5_SACKO|nr:PREDICTED: transmembrane emp24 domain-containing protein 7-like [Saccoglossus kowalevskii]